VQVRRSRNLEGGKFFWVRRRVAADLAQADMRPYPPIAVTFSHGRPSRVLECGEATLALGSALVMHNKDGYYGGFGCSQTTSASATSHPSRDAYSWLVPSLKDTMSESVTSVVDRQCCGTSSLSVASRGAQTNWGFLAS